MFVGCLLDVRWIFVRCSSDVCWMFVGCYLVVHVGGVSKIEGGEPPPQTLDPKCETETDDEDNDKTLTRSGCKSLG